jgi:hypothetical protein
MIKLFGFLLLLSCLFASSKADQTCQVRFINACTSVTGPVGLSIGSVNIPNVLLGIVSGYVQVSVGPITLQVLGPNGNLVSLQVNLQPDTHYTVALVGDKLLSLEIFIDDVAVNVNVDVPQVRVALLGLLNIDLNVYANLNLLGLLKANADLSISLGYQPVVAGNVSLIVKNLLGLNIVANVFVAAPGSAYTCYLIPSNSASAIFDVLVVPDIIVNVQAKVQLRLLHGLVPLLGNLDLVVNGNVVIPGVVYGQVFAYVSLDAGEIDLQVRVAGTATIVVELKGIKLVAGNSYTLCVFGESKPFVKLVLDTVLNSPSDVLVRVLHLAESLLLPQVVSIADHILLHLIPNPLGFQQLSNFVPIVPKAPLSLSIATSLGQVLANLNLNLDIGNGGTVCIIGSSYSSKRPLTLVLLNNNPININIDLKLPNLNIEVGLLGLYVNVNLLGLLNIGLLL